MPSEKCYSAHPPAPAGRKRRRGGCFLGSQEGRPNHPKPTVAASKAQHWSQLRQSATLQPLRALHCLAAREKLTKQCLKNAFKISSLFSLQRYQKKQRLRRQCSRNQPWCFLEHPYDLPKLLELLKGRTPANVLGFCRFNLFNLYLEDETNFLLFLLPMAGATNTFALSIEALLGLESWTMEEDRGSNRSQWVPLGSINMVWELLQRAHETKK